MYFLSTNISSWQICLAFGREAFHGSFMTPTGSAISLRSVWVNKGPAMIAIGGEEVRQFLKEIDFSIFIKISKDI